MPANYIPRQEYSALVRHVWWNLNNLSLRGERPRLVKVIAVAKQMLRIRVSTLNCGQLDHPRFRCPCPSVKCQTCGANHLNELCPKGPGGALRDSLSSSAKQALDRQTSKATGAAVGSTSTSGGVLTLLAHPLLQRVIQIGCIASTVPTYCANSPQHKRSPAINHQAIRG